MIRLDTLFPRRPSFVPSGDPLNPEPPFQSDQRRTLLWLTVLLSFLVLDGIALAPTPLTTLTCALLLLACEAVRSVSRKHLAGAALLLVAVMFAFNWSLFDQLHTSLFTLLWIPILLVGICLCTFRQALILLLACSYAILHREGLQGISALLTLWITGAFCAIAFYGLRQELGVMRGYLSYSIDQLDRSRSDRGELARIAKALSEAREDLSQANTELRFARDTAEESRRLKMQFAANVSHELRTPINLIVGFSEMIALGAESYGVPLPPVYRSDVHAIYRNAKHLQGLINDILDVSQIEADRLAMIKELASPGEVIQEAVLIARDLIEKKGLSLNFHVEPDLPLLWMDRLRIRQVILNLLANSVRFTDTGSITLTGTLKRNEIWISVADTGIGIPKEEIANVFKEFYQVEGSLSRKTGGTGLGLTLSQSFIEQHGGHLWVESEGIPGKGATFIFTLPAAHRATRARATAPRPASSVKHILLYDQDPAILQLFKGYIHEHRVDTVQSVDDLLAALRHRHPTAVVLAGDDQFTRLEQDIGEIAAETALIGCPMPSNRRMTTLDGITHVLPDAVSRDQLIKTVESLNRPIHKALMIGDEPDAARMFARMLYPYAVQIAFGVDEGLELLNTELPDLVVLDLRMPEADRQTVIDCIRTDSQLNETSIILVSAYADDPIAASVRGDLILRKPQGFAPIELVNCVEALVTNLKPNSAGGQ